MRHYAPAVIVSAIVITATVWLGGVRIIMVRPLSVSGAGFGAVMHGLPGAALVDSPEAACTRDQGRVNGFCRTIILQAMTDPDKIILRLPYSDALHDMTLRRAVRAYAARHK